MQNILKQKWAFIPAILFGVITLTLLIKNKNPPDITPLKESAKTVHVIQVPEVSVTPIIKGNGTVSPEKIWRSIAEVSGKIIEIHPQLKKGAIINDNDLLIKIDPIDYELAVSQAQANINSNKAQIAELTVQQSNTRSLLEIEEKSLQLSKNEVGRKKKLFNENSISRAEYDKEKKNLFKQQVNYASLNNTMALFPVQRLRLKAESKKLEAQLATATHNLSRTVIHMPFTGRISDVKIEVGQYVRQGELLAIADSMNKAEINVQIPINSMGRLLRTNKLVTIENLSATQSKKILNINARVFLKLGEKTAQWSGKVSRISETIDLKTRTIGVIVEVNDPYKNIIPGVKPPLMKGMFVSVELSGQLQQNSLIIPRSSLYLSKIRIVNKNNRLESRNVTVSSISNGLAVISSGLTKGEVVITSDLSPAIEGMLLHPINDESTLKTLLKRAASTTEIGVSQ